MVVLAYQKMLNSHPIITQSITTATLFGLGDVIAQKLIEGTPEFDFKRCSTLMSFGGFVAGPSIAKWYILLGKHIKLSTPFKTLTAKVAADQFLFAPTFYALFFAYTGCFEGKSLTQINDKIVTLFPSTLLAGYKIWPAIQFVNFKFVPINYQSMVVNTVSIGWNSYMSHKNTLR